MNNLFASTFIAPHDGTIEESNMIFGPYPRGHCFYIEKCPGYLAIQDGVKIAEFALLRTKSGKQIFWIVEAKSSSPRPDNDNFDKYIGDIRDKFINTISLMVASCLGRHMNASTQLPPEIGSLDLTKLQFRLILVINGCQKAWLPPIEEAMSKAMLATRKTWSLAPASVVVMNEVMAQKHDLILANNSAQ